MEKAERRARRLLRSHLSASQNQSLTDKNYFAVRGNASGVMYRIHGLDRYNRLGQNIRDLGGFKYGVGLESDAPFWADWRDHSYPPSDVMLAQKLLIETDERKFLRLACKSPAR